MLRALLFALKIRSRTAAHNRLVLVSTKLLPMCQSCRLCDWQSCSSFSELRTVWCINLHRRCVARTWEQAKVNPC
jgi:hypothetical protein